MYIYNGMFYDEFDDKDLIKDLINGEKRNIETISGFIRQLDEISSFYDDVYVMDAEHMKNLNYYERKYLLEVMSFLNEANEIMAFENEKDIKDWKDFCQEKNKPGNILKKFIKEERKFYLKKLKKIDNVKEVLVSSCRFAMSNGTTAGTKILAQNMVKTLKERFETIRDIQIDLLKRFGLNEFESKQEKKDKADLEDIFIFD